MTSRVDGSRIFALWIQNTAGINHLPGKAPAESFRADMLGQFVWRYSDDKGISWSKMHYAIPVPLTFIDRRNTWNGTVQVRTYEYAPTPNAQRPTPTLPQAQTQTMDLLEQPEFYKPFIFMLTFDNINLKT